jgi:hypothetical protein
MRYTEAGDCVGSRLNGDRNGRWTFETVAKGHAKISRVLSKHDEDGHFLDPVVWPLPWPRDRILGAEERPIQGW